jgi:quercetin dioxygenase-like cupin family protein
MSAIHRFIGTAGNWEWEGVAVHNYGSARPGVNVRRFISRQDSSNNLELRYFELEPGSCSNHERHNYEHAVLVLRGRGQVRIGDDLQPIHTGDAIFLEANEIHQFLAAENETLGFLCAVLDKDLRPGVHGAQTLEIFN